MVFLVRQALPFALLLALALLKPNLGGRVFRPFETALARLSRRPRQALVLVGLLGAFTGAGVSLLCGLPKPAVHDEFSYLLAADTYAHGRLTNPTPPLWPHFETFHVLMRPSYQSKYPPGQGLVLAFGQRIFGQPIVGTWICMGLACAALTWMLRAWMPGRWALLGGLLATVNLPLLEWCHNYWGGVLAVLGGALALGGLRWSVRRPTGRHGALLGLGIGLLAVSRPYEGFVYSCLLLGVLLPGLRETPEESGDAGGWTRRVLRVGAPLALVVLMALGALGLYNRAVTGSVLRLPYSLYEEQYAIVPLFLFQPTRPAPVIRDPVMRRYAEVNQLAPYRSRRTLRGYLQDTWNRARICVLGYLRPAVLVLPLLALPWSLRRDRWMRRVAAVLALFLFFISLEKGMFLHYTAPMMGLTWLFALQGIRALRAWRPGGRAAGRFIVRAVVAIALALTVKWAHDYRGQDFGTLPRERPRLTTQLERIPGDHLVLVHYRPNHKVDEEWVYNRADLLHARIVWAREFGGADDRDLLALFRGRHIWRLDADAHPPTLSAVNDLTPGPAPKRRGM